MALPQLGRALETKDAAHLLRRATFGATKEQIIKFTNLSVATAIDRIFNNTLPDPVLPLDPKTGKEWFKSGVTDANSKGFELENYFKGWFISQMMSTGIDDTTDEWLAYSAREKIVMFLHTHFTAITEKIGNSRALYFQNQLYRQFALDGNNVDPKVNFKSLTVKVSVDNAMIRLLDGSLNVKGSVNENYARELLELYAIGRGSESKLYAPTTDGTEGDYGVYREADVQMAARVLTGWDFDDTFASIDPDTNLPRAKLKSNGAAHDNDFTGSKAKTFSDRFSGKTITAPDPLLFPTPEEQAIDEIRQLVDIIYSPDHTNSPNEAAKNICRKIYRFFVWAPHIDAEVTVVEAIINQMVQTFVSNGYKILPVIKELLGSEHFYDSAPNGPVADDNYGSLIKSPLDLVLGTLRFFNVKLPNMVTDTVNFYKATDEILGYIKNQSMDFYQPYDVAGYEAYHQYPTYHRFWITTNTLTKRYDFIRQLIQIPNTKKLQVNTYQYVLNHFAADAPNADNLLKAIILYMLPHHTVSNNLTDQRFAYFKDRFLSAGNMNPEAYWSSNWGTDGELQAWLNLLFEAVLESPEYQLA